MFLNYPRESASIGVERNIDRKFSIGLSLPGDKSNEIEVT